MTDAASKGTPTVPPPDTSPTDLYHCLQQRISYDEAKAFPPDIKIAT